MLGRVYGKGLNILGQIGPRTSPSCANWTQIESLRDCTVRSVGCGFLQTYFFMGTNQVVQMGYVLDNLTTIRILSYYKKWPSMFLKYQKYTKYILGKTVSFNNCLPEPSALNNDIINRTKFVKMASGGCFLMCLDSQQGVWSIGQNVKGQLGLNTIKFGGNFTPVLLPMLTKVVDVSCGYQHALFAGNDGTVYGCGKGNRSQIVPFIEKGSLTTDIKDFYMEPVPICKQLRITKVAGGFGHSLFLSQHTNKLYGMGSNKRSQCAQNPLTTKEVKYPQQIFCYFSKEEKILDVKCGFNHSVVLTDRKAYLFGTNQHNQYPFPQLIREDICSPLEIPLEGKPIKIFAGFDRTAVITDRNECWVFGGEDLTQYGGPDGKLQKIQFEVGPHSSVGLGYMHTVLSI